MQWSPFPAFISEKPAIQFGILHKLVWCLTKFMLTTITDFDTALVMDKNSSMDIVSVCKPHCNTTKFKLL